MCVRKLPAKVRRTLAAKKAWRSRKSTSADRRRMDEELLGKSDEEWDLEAKLEEENEARRGRSCG
jgi:hypothetical protein